LSFPGYPKYKDSGVEWLGQIPAHWELRRLKQVCLVRPSNVDKKAYEGDEPVRLCNYTDVYYNDVITNDLDFMPATATEEQVARFTLLAGDVIITKDSETAHDIAVAAYVPRDLPGIVCGYHLAILRPKAGYDGEYIKRLFDSVFVKSCVAVRANGLTRVGLPQYAIDNLLLPVPPDSEQRSIAAAVAQQATALDSLIGEQERLIDLLKEKRQAAISHAVTKGLDANASMKSSGIDWLGHVPAHWDVLPVRRIIRRIEQGWSPECESREAEPHEWGVLKAGCVNGGIFWPNENKALPDHLKPETDLEVHTGDLLMSRASGSPALVGSAALVPAVRRRLMLSDKIFRLHPENIVTPEYLTSIFASGMFRGQVEGTLSGAEGLANNLPQSKLLAFYCALPPISEQMAITTYLNAEFQRLHSLLSKAEAAVRLLYERRTALISAAVTGKIDVRHLAQDAA
jgi:type I restriction enzyme, S subunit